MTIVKRFVQGLESNGHSLTDLGFQQAATVEAINKVEEVTKQTLPESLKELLTIADGQDYGSFLFLPDQTTLLSCEDITALWLGVLPFAEDDSEFYNAYQDKDRIRQVIIHPSRIPIASQEGMWSIYLDYDPGPQGTRGQLICLINECDFIVLAASFGEFLSSYALAMEKGLLKFRPGMEGYENKFEMRPDTEKMDAEDLVRILTAVQK